MAHVRPIRPEDADGVRRFHAGQSAESIYLRFFAPLKQLSDRDVARFTEVDYHRAGRPRGDGARRDHRHRPLRLHRRDHAPRWRSTSPTPTRAGAWGRCCWSTSRRSPRRQGVRRFVADVLPQNRKMISVFTEAGYEVSHHYDDGVIAVSFTITPTEQSQAVRPGPRAPRRVGEHARRCSSPGRSRWSAPAGGADSIGHRTAAEHPRPAASPARSTRSTPRRARSWACSPTPGSATSPPRWTWPSSRCRRSRSWTSCATARAPASRACWWSRPGSPRPGRRGRSASASCCAPPGPAACG